MFIVSGEKGTGKTKALLEKAKAENGVIACADPISMRARAYSYGIVGLDIISYDDLYNKSIGDKALYIHDINKFIRYSFPEAQGYTLCVE
jgi:hypothetical protein